MYSSVNNHEKHQSILSFQEIIGIIVVFSFMLYLLFPKGNIEQILEGQGGHANLSIPYLKSIILYHPDNIELKMILMQKYRETGEEKKALLINRELIQSTNKKPLLTKLYKVEYLLEKALYFEKPTKEKLQKLKNKLLRYYQYSQGDNSDYLFFFAQSSSIDYGYLKYHSLVHFMKENPKEVNYKLEKMAYDLATKLGYKKEAYARLQRLIKYPQLDDALREYLVYSLFERQEFTKARKITTQFFLNSQTEDEITKFFHLALYSLAQDPTRTPTEISQLIQNYAKLKKLLAPDIVIILNTLLELGASKEAAQFAINMFDTEPEQFNEAGIDLALRSLLYNSKLEQAQAFSLFAEAKFKKEKYLDKSIQISGWLSDADMVAALNKQGYYEYNPKKYEQYFLKNENFDSDHEILGDIFKAKVHQKKYKYLDSMADYYEYTGEIDKAEVYFTNLYKTTKEKKASYYAIEFAYKNSHFEKGLKRYKAYQSTYGIVPKLQNLSIKGLLALKRFKDAYAMTKASEKNNFLSNKRRFTNLAWQEQDYAYLQQKYWDFESNNALEADDFEHFLLLEKELGGSNKIDYLYKKAWKKTNNSYYLSNLMSKLLQEKKFQKFQNIVNRLSKKERSILEKNINFNTLMAHYYVRNSQTPLALESYEKIFKIAPNKVSSHQSYLWFLIDNQEKYPQLRKRIALELNYLKEQPHLREKIGIVSVVAAMSTQKYKLATKWIKKLLKKNQKNKEYSALARDIRTIKHEKRYASYDKMLNPDYLNAEVNLKTKNLGSLLSVNETAFSYQWQLYQNIKSKIMFKQYEYSVPNKNSDQQTSFEIALKNANQNFLWDISLAHTQTDHSKKDFNSASLNLAYSTHNLKLNLNSKYQKKTTLTPELEHNALENALALNVQVYANRRTSFSFLTQKSDFTRLDGVYMGEAKKVQLNANYILRAAYPDIAFNSYLSHNQFSKNIAQDFSEFGISSSVGTSRQHSLNSSWKPFATVAFAINDTQNVGSSLTFGVSKMLTGDDSLDVLFDYYNGIGVISDPIYGLNVKYRF